MSGERVVIVGDAHLGSGDPADEGAFHEFLEAVPTIGDRLIVMGDLFEFWFEYRRVIPRRYVQTVTALSALKAKGIPIDFFGGNHDRWGGDFWSEDLGVPFHPDGAEMTIAGRKAWVHHGDGLAEQKLGGVLIHKFTRSPITIAIFRALHPDFGWKLTDKLSKVLGETNKTPAAMDATAAAQERYARALLDKRPELQLLLLAHTHRQRLIEHAPGRFYLNAGQWMKERQYAVVRADAIWTGMWPARPAA